MTKLIVSVLFGVIYALHSPITFGGNSHVKSEEMSRVLNRLLDHQRYDSRIRPNYGDGPLIVTVGFWILSIEKLDVVKMDFTIDLFLRQEWTDKRLDHGLNQTITLSRRVWKKVWTPDSYFVNAKMGKLHRVTAPNMMLMIAPGGLVKYNARATIRAACPVDLRKFPMDIQVCPLILESYAYDNQHIRYKWEVSGGEGEKFLPPNARLTSIYTLTKINLSLEMTQYVVGNFSGVRAEFTFKRSYSYFLSHMYGTSTVIVVISWMGFVLPLDQTAARIALGITSVLTEVTILNMMNNSMPKVSYVKSGDKYLIGCFVFVFLTLVEYCAVLLLKAKQRKKNIKEYERKQMKSEETPLPQNNKRSRMFVSMVEANSNCQPPRMAHNTSPETWETESNVKQVSRLAAFVENAKIKILTDTFIFSVDEYSFKVFPVAFAMYNAFYWLDYL